MQLAAQRVFENGLLERHLPAVRARYQAAAGIILDALAQSMPAGVTWNPPVGGMFVWGSLPEGMDATKVLAKAIERRVAFVPGMAFYAADPDPRTMRMSFVTVPEPKLREGVRNRGRGHRRRLIAPRGHPSPAAALSGGAAPDPATRRCARRRPRRRPR